MEKHEQLQIVAYRWHLDGQNLTYWHGQGPIPPRCVPYRSYPGIDNDCFTRKKMRRESIY